MIERSYTLYVSIRLHIILSQHLLYTCTFNFLLNSPFYNDRRRGCMTSPNSFNFLCCVSSAIYSSTISHRSCSFFGSVSSIGKLSGSPTIGLNRKYFVDAIFVPEKLAGRCEVRRQRETIVTQVSAYGLLRQSNEDT